MGIKPIVKNIEKYKGAIFDLDGTLLDSMYVWDNLCRDWLSSKKKAPLQIWKTTSRL
ncbi:hypothetical protein AGMMS50212_07920 [Spirochaetia bacterium]|nr:hypothetical protein AGMMS50212_07810 [Spirochaetia bacterium]GHV83452.1 hypothetical protein AGMMS50212_07920 [Spirochaetia bacterium]